VVEQVKLQCQLNKNQADIIILKDKFGYLVYDREWLNTYTKE